MNSFPFVPEEIIKDYAALGKREAVEIKVLKVLKRPLSVVARIHIVFRDDRQETVYLKYYRPLPDKDMSEVVQRDYDTSLFWWERFKQSEKYNVIEPLFVDVEKHVMLTRESRGHDIQTYLNKSGHLFGSFDDRDQIMEMMRLCGGWLRYFQQIPLEGDDKAAVSLDYLLEYIKVRMDRIVEKTNIGFDRALQEKVNDYLKRQWARMEDGENKVSYLHSDFSLSNVLFDEQGVTVLDFTKKETGSVYKDLTRFFHQLILLSYKPNFKKEFINDMQRHFLEGYGDPLVYEKPMFRIFLMIHVINHLGKSARFWEQSAKGRLYNRWVVYNVMKRIKKVVA